MPKFQLYFYNFQNSKNKMAAAQVAKNLKDRRQRQNLEDIFKKVELLSSWDLIIEL